MLINMLQKQFNKTIEFISVSSVSALGGASNMNYSIAAATAPQQESGFIKVKVMGSQDFLNIKMKIISHLSFFQH